MQMRQQGSWIDDCRAENLMQCGLVERSATLEWPLRPSSRPFLRHQARHSSHSNEIAGRHGQFEVLIDTLDAAVHGLSEAPHRLAPAEVFFDAFANGLTQFVARMASRARIDRTAAPARLMTGHVWCHAPLATTLHHEIPRVIRLVGGHCLGMLPRHRLEHCRSRSC